MAEALVSDQDLIDFLNWCLPQLNLRWQGFRKVRGTVRKRLARRIRELGLSDLGAYRERLEADPDEWRVVDRACRIPISRFYRDRAVYEMLAARVLPDCADTARAGGRKTVRILSAGCASGEEPYTVSLIWHLRLAERVADIALEIRAVDIDDVMVERAETACYASGSFKDMPADILQAGFEPSEHVHCLRARFRQDVCVDKWDLREGVPEGPFDLILCRNTVFTYFDLPTQAKVFDQLDGMLREGGYLIIGAHETLPSQSATFFRLQQGVPLFRKHGAV